MSDTSPPSIPIGKKRKIDDGDRPRDPRRPTPPVPCFEWRCPNGDDCPNGDQCNKGFRLYKKNTREEAGAWHLHDKHDILWDDAMAMELSETETEKEVAIYIETGVTETEKEVAIYIDAER